jgi:hypothetical protein
MSCKKNIFFVCVVLLPLAYATIFDSATFKISSTVEEATSTIPFLEEDAFSIVATTTASTTESIVVLASTTASSSPSVVQDTIDIPVPLVELMEIDSISDCLMDDGKRLFRSQSECIREFRSQL